ncbi:hypothetical protein [Streptomyces sp. NPDC017940]|uniref:hypothetical protein n=1 Tax=Streptomyces sp. NPDC017940 TaxID=3365017 RepID=UPI00378E0CED
MHTSLPEPKFVTAQGRGDRAVLSGEVTDDEGTLGPGQHVGPQLEVTDSGSIGLILAGGRGPDAVDLVGGVGHVLDQIAPGGMVPGRRHGIHGAPRGGQQRVRVRQYVALERLGAFLAPAARNDC